MWSTADVINDLRSHRQTCAKVEIIKNILEQQTDYKTPDSCTEELHAQYAALLTKKNTVEGWLKILPTEERFLVQTHLVNGLDWAKTIVEYETMWGIMNGRSERTLKRIQAKAVERIVACLNQINHLSRNETEEVK